MIIVFVDGIDLGQLGGLWFAPCAVCSSYLEVTGLPLAVEQLYVLVRLFMWLCYTGTGSNDDLGNVWLW